MATAKAKIEKWPAEVRVCFIPHERRNAKGEVEFRVTKADLEKIVANTNKSCESRTYPLQMIGHRDPAEADIDQTAEPIGFADKFWMGEYDGQPAIYCRLRLDPESDYTSKSELRKYPYLSVEYIHGARKIIGVSRLMRQPYLNVGVSTYQFSQLDSPVCDSPIYVQCHHNNRVTCYAMEGAAMAKNMPDNDEDGFDEKIYEAVKKRLCKEYNLTPIGGGDPASPGGAGGSMPKLDLSPPKKSGGDNNMPDDDGDDDDMDKEPMPPSMKKEMKDEKKEDKEMSYSADPVVARKVLATRRELRKMKLSTRRRMAETVIGEMVRQGLQLNPDDARTEVDALLAYEDDRWQTRVDYLKRVYKYSDPYRVEVASGEDITSYSAPRDRDSAAREAANAASERAIKEGYTNYSDILAEERKKRNLS